jgi:transglutaminase-like putative cysteine protease
MKASNWYFKRKAGLLRLKEENKMNSILKEFLNVLFIYVLVLQPAFSDENIPIEKFIASKISPELLKNANAVVRYESNYFIVDDIKSATQKVHRVVTILNADGQSFGSLEIGYDKFLKIEDIDGKIYDAEGKVIRSMNSDDIKDYAGTSFFSLYDDSRIKSVELIHNIFPYTIEFEYEISYRGYISWPSWYPEERNASVEYSKFEVSIPAEKQLRYRKNNNIEPVIETHKKISTYRWEAASLPPFEEEPVGPDLLDQYKCVEIAPDQFEIDGYEGDLSSWKTFGEWIYNLYLNKQKLPDQERQKVISLTSDLTDSKEKIKVLYNYLQSKTRYVSVQLGIGGWEPFDASYVCEKGYGDCKALTNYMLSLLNVVDIPAYPALIYNSRLPRATRKDFPSNQFNHVILFVPLKEDTIWLECTSRNTAFGRIGNDNENRYALIITPRGGELVRTPSSKAVNNCLIQKVNLTINPFGNSVADVHATYNGNQQDYISSSLKEATPKERNEWLKENIHIPSFNLMKTDFSQLELKSDKVTLNFQLDLPRYASVAGSRILVQPNLLNRRSYVPKAIEKRKHPVVLSYAYLDIDSIFMKIPVNLSVEAMPKPVLVETPFGKYSSNIISIDRETLIYSRYLEMSFTELPPESYNDYRNFLQQIVQADKANIVFIRK